MPNTNRKNNKIPPSYSCQSPTILGFLKFYLLIYLLIYLFLATLGLVAELRLSLVVVSGGYTSLRCGVRASLCGGFSCCRARTPGTWASVVVAHGPGSSWTRIFRDKGSNLCPLHWQVDS